jgi:hypothetical protein
LQVESKLSSYVTLTLAQRTIISAIQFSRNLKATKYACRVISACQEPRVFARRIKIIFSTSIRAIDLILFLKLLQYLTVGFKKKREMKFDLM